VLEVTAISTSIAFGEPCQNRAKLNAFQMLHEHRTITLKTIGASFDAPPPKKISELVQKHFSSKSIEIVTD
jgi:hypothetical protein